MINSASLAKAEVERSAKPHAIHLNIVFISAALYHSRVSASRKTILTLALLLASCGSPTPSLVTPYHRHYGSNSITANWESFFEDTYSDTKSLDVIYVTNRQLIGNRTACSDDAFGVEMSA